MRDQPTPEQTAKEPSDKDFMAAHIEALEEEINILTATLARVKAEQLSAEAEQALRQHLWLSHGHRGVYGDDGEMQCGECMPLGMWDYKREPLEKVVFTAIAARHAVNAAALRALVDPPVSSSTEKP